MTDISRRKREHMEIAMQSESQTDRSASWDSVFLLPKSLPELSLNDIDLTTTFAGHELGAPVVISGMTGGHQDALMVNRNLAIAAAELGLGIGVGSQRAALNNKELRGTYEIVRETAPEALVIGNIGMCQLVTQANSQPLDRTDIEDAVSMIDADLLAIHLNAVEELVQPEGDRNMKGILDAIRECVKWSPAPILAKETGAGMTRETAMDLERAGVYAIDVGGIGGTSFARVEALRAKRIGDQRGTRVGDTFGEWGIPTVLALLEVRDSPLPVIATGGVRNGLHAAKAISLGASLVGIGAPAIRAAKDGPRAVIDELSLITEELRMSMILTGCRTISELRSVEFVLSGDSRDWASARGVL